ncbi:hypothetical protein [Streptomyces griseolus]|nr:hypothetical protein [Streptomyces griseolus]MCW8220081.1 hypothetical protein [Streptomyces griseolus]
MNDSTPSEPTPKNGEPTFFAKTAKNWYTRHRSRILAVGSVALAVVVAGLAERRDSEDTEVPEAVSPPESLDEPRRSSSAYDVDPFLRRLPEGQNASKEKKARYKEETGNDLPPGHTSVRGWSFPGDEPEKSRQGHA